MEPNPKFVFQLAILLLALVIFLGIYILKKGLPIQWKSKAANRYFRWSLAISVLVFLLVIIVTIILTN